MIEDVWVGHARDDALVDVYATEDVADGSFRCAECGYGVAVTAALPPCPMCAGRVWEAISG